MSKAGVATPQVQKGLQGVVLDETAVSTVGKGDAGLTYRGYAIEELASQLDFEDVAHLLLRGDFASTVPGGLQAYKAKLASYRALSANMKQLLELIPAT